MKLIPEQIISDVLALRKYTFISRKWWLFISKYISCRQCI